MRFNSYLRNPDPVKDLFLYCLSQVYDDGDPRTEHLERLSPEARLVFLVSCFDGEVHNGGFDQLFFNSLGDHCQEIEACLEVIGAIISRELLCKAMSFFPEGFVPQDRAERQRVWMPLAEEDEISKSLNELDQQFYKYEDNIGGKLLLYMESNPYAFVVVGSSN